MADWIYLLSFIVILLASVPLLGNYIAQLFQGKKTFLHPILGWLEVGTYKIAGIDANIQMSWIAYAKALSLCNLIGGLLLFIILIAQPLLPFNPAQLPSVPLPLAFNITISFVTNTNWQSYAGETTLSYAAQMAGLTVQNFLSAATGITVFLALVRGLTNHAVENLGNFWVDLVRAVIYLLLPLALIFALFLVSQGVIQNLADYITVQTLEGASQVIPGGQVASQVAIKQLGTNGGGFFNVNSAHPFENPTLFTNFAENFAILLIPASLTYAYGLMVRSRRHGLLILIVMTAFWLSSILIANYATHLQNPFLDGLVNLEGYETRFNLVPTALWTASTTTASNGSVNADLSSLSPLASGIALFNMLLGGVIFGGIGVGLCHMIMFIILTVFMAGLMVGRTPQYLGKRIEKTEVQSVVTTVLLPGILIFLGSAISTVTPSALASISQPAPHGLTEIVYAFASVATNNGSALAGLGANNDYYNILLAITMLLTRFSIIIPSLALAGILARKKAVPISIGTFSTETALFALLLSSTILIVGALTFFPALSLGPIVEHLLMIKGTM